MEKTTVPSTVRRAAKTLIDLYGENIVFIGHKEAIDIFRFQFPEDTRTGYPFVFLYDKRKDSVNKITGFEALNIIAEWVNE